MAHLQLLSHSFITNRPLTILEEIYLICQMQLECTANNRENYMDALARSPQLPMTT